MIISLMKILIKFPHEPQQLIALICFLVFIIPNNSVSQTTQEGILNIGFTQTIHSSILNEKRTIWIHIPEAYSDSEEAYPVVYLLDGNTHFKSVVGMIEALSSKNNSIIPKMIVVGILNTDRLRDLTPKHGNKENGPNTSGGGETFMDFMQKELIPFIDKTYPTKPYRLFIGHSLGGLTVINTMLKRPEIFNSYIALDPSLWWSDSATLQEAKMILNNKKLSNETLYVAIANTMTTNMTLKNVVQDTSKQTQHIRDILEFSTQVVPKSTSELEFKYQYYPNEGHSSLPLIATYDALRYIFLWYDLDKTYIPLIINPKINETTLIKTLTDHYEIVSSKLGYTVLPPESLVNQFGYGCLRRKLFDKAEVLFKLNVKNYPNKSNVFDSLGDFYSEVGEIDKAIIAFKKAINTGKGNRYSKDKLNALLAKADRP